MAENRQKKSGVAPRNPPSGASPPGPTLELLDALPDMCFVVSPEGHLIRSNAKGAALIEPGDGSPGSIPFASFVSSLYRESFKENLRRCFADAGACTFEGELVARDGNEIDVEFHLSRFTMAGNPAAPRCLVIARDISSIKQTELDLLRFTNLAHFTVNPIEITDIAGNIIYVNPAFEKASGYKKEEVLGKNPNIFSSRKHPKSFWQKMWQTISSGKVWDGEVVNKRRNGEPFYTRLLISPIVDGESKVVGYFGIHRDISEQKQLQQQLIHAQKMESIGLLAAGLAHEVGNPLTSISSVVQIIQRTTQDQFTQEKLELIKAQISRISRIIRDLVNFSRRSTYEVQLTDVNKNIRDAVAIVRVGKKAKDVTITVELDESLPLLSLVPDQIEQVFINLLINAVDALFDADTGSSASPLPRREKVITVRSCLQGGDIVITVEDNGRGIKEEDLPKIFEPFFTTKKVGEGTGLGLWVSYGIIKSFRGEIKVKSMEGVGTGFTIRLPLQPEYS